MSTRKPTPNPALNNVLSDLATGMRAVLAENTVGIYLQGSLATGDFDEHSDVDFVVVVDREPSGDELAALGAEIFRLHGGAKRFAPDSSVQTRPSEENHWRSSLEGSFFPKDRLRDWNTAGGEVWYVDNGSTTLEQSSHDDTLVVRWTLREKGITLFGPRPSEWIDPIPQDALRREVLITMGRIAEGFEAELASSELKYWNTVFGQCFAVLTMCRTLQTLHTGEIHSKLQGVRWGKESLPAEWSDLIAQSWEQRKGATITQAATAEDLQRTQDFITYALERSRNWLERHPA